MKRIQFFSVAAVLLLTGPVSADLVVQDYLANGEQVVLDTVTGDHWYWNLPDFVNKTYAEQMTAIGGLGTYGNIEGGWHMATLAEVQALGAHGGPIGLAIALKFAPTDPDPATSMGRIDFAHPPGGPHYLFHVHNWQGQWGFSSTSDESAAPQFSAWVTSSAPVVPAPGALVLAATGLLSVLGVNRWRRKS